MPCRGGGACSTTRPSEPGDRRETKLARAEGLEPPTKPGVGSRRSATELRASGRRDRDRTDGLLRFRQALYALLSYSPNCELPVDLAGLEPTASALQVRCSPVLSYRPRARRHGWQAGIQLRSDRRQLGRTSNADRLPHKTPSPKQKKKARIGPQQIESNESSPCLRSSIAANNVGASVPPLRAGHGEMKARVDCGNADPPCVSALLCRCSRAEHLIGARWWKKDSNLRVPHGSHLDAVRVWLDY